MTELGQQALLAPEPTRVVRADPACTFWGVDPGTLRVSIAWRDAAGENTGATTRSFPRFPDGGERLIHIHRETRQLAYDLTAAAYGETPAAGRPGFVWVELPAGKPNPQLAYAVGVIQAAVYSGIHAAIGRSVTVEDVPSSTWKKTATGRGDAGSKRRGGKAEIVQWARENGWTGTVEDEADAWGIALAASRTVRFA